MLNRDHLKRKAAGSQNDQLTYKKARNRVTYAPKGAKSKYYRTSIRKTLNDLTGKKPAVTEISEIQGSSSETLTNAKDIADHLNKHFTQIGSDLAGKIPAAPVNPEDYLR